MADVSAEFLDNLIAKLWLNQPEPRGTPAGVTIAEIDLLCQAIQPVFLAESCVLEVTPPVVVCGDIHGQFHDLLRVFDTAGRPPHAKFLFLGDYIDRGYQGVDCVCLLFAYKLRFPESVFLLRGNHECNYINRMYGFYEECSGFYPSTKAWTTFCETFQCLPIAATINDKIFCVHGGISPHLESLDDIREIQRPLEIPEQGLLCDLMWSDPEPSIETWAENTRGTSFLFGARQVDDFLAKFGFDLICRAHQAVDGGYDFPFHPDQSLITLFTAPNYCYEFGNKGAVLKVDENLFCSFLILEVDATSHTSEVNERPGTPPRDTTGDADNFQLDE
jgi:serine/threonine-protein phosphatase PP1 catalytic subunit